MTFVRRVAAVGAISIIAASCSSSKTTATTTTGATTTGATTTVAGDTTTTTGATTTVPDVLGTPTAATGTALKVGYIYSGVSAGIDATEELNAAQAVVKYYNEYKGGFGGHKLELDVCGTNEDPAIAADCGAKMVSDGVPIVLMNVNGQVAPWIKTVSGAGIPTLAFAAADVSMLGQAAFSMSNGLAGLGAFPASIAKEKGVKSAAIMSTNVPAAIGAAKALAPLAFTPLGITDLNIVGIDAAASDMGPDAQAIIAKGAQLVHIIGNPSFCSTAIKGLRDASFKGTITMISNCLDKTVVSSLGAQLKDIIVSYAAGEDPANADIVLFKGIVAKYDSKVNPAGTPVGSFAVITAFNEIMAKVTGDVTKEAVTAAIKTGGPYPYPTLKGATFNCDGKAIAIFPPVCTVSYATAVLDDKGTATNFKVGS